MKFFRSLPTAVGMFLLSASVALAQDEINIQRPEIVKIENLGKLLGSFIGLMLIISVLLALFYLLWGGIQWITSGGDKSAVETARQRIQAALLGLVIVFAVWAIFTLVGNFLGIDPFNLTLPDPTGP